MLMLIQFDRFRIHSWQAKSGVSMATKGQDNPWEKAQWSRGSDSSSHLIETCGFMSWSLLGHKGYQTCD